MGEHIQPSSRPQARKGVQRDESLWRCLRKTARRAGEKGSPEGQVPLALSAQDRSPRRRVKHE